jgi:hypothetical protein
MAAALNVTGSAPKNILILEMRVFIKIQRHPKYTKYSYRERISPPLGGLGGKNKESSGARRQKK